MGFFLNLISFFWREGESKRKSQRYTITGRRLVVGSVLSLYLFLFHPGCVVLWGCFVGLSEVLLSWGDLFFIRNFRFWCDLWSYWIGVILFFIFFFKCTFRNLPRKCGRNAKSMNIHHSLPKFRFSCEMCPEGMFYLIWKTLLEPAIELCLVIYIALEWKDSDGEISKSLSLSHQPFAY